MTDSFRTGHLPRSTRDLLQKLVNIKTFGSGGGGGDVSGGRRGDGSESTSELLAMRLRSQPMLQKLHLAGHHWCCGSGNFFGGDAQSERQHVQTCPCFTSPATPIPHTRW